VYTAPESSALLAAERDNVRLALIWLDERGKMDELLSRTLLLARLWFAPGLYGEGLDWIDHALDRSSQVASVARFRALAMALALALQRGDHPRAAVFVAEGLAIARRVGDPVLIGEALTNAGYLAYRQAEYGRAEELLLEAHERLRGRASESWYGTPHSLLGDMALAQERFDQAAVWYAEAIEILETAGHSWDLIDARAGLGGVNVCTDNLVQAAALYRDSLERARAQGFTVLVSTSLLGLAAVAVASGQPETGAHLLGAAEGLAESLGAPIYPRDRPVRDRALAALKITLSEQPLAAAREAGRTLTIEAAIAEAEAAAAAVLSSP
jgi:tetratricopeptide (TPR) repeat protein